MTGSTIRNNKKQDRALPFLARFAQKSSTKKSANGDTGQKHSTIITEVRRETTDDR